MKTTYYILLTSLVLLTSCDSEIGIEAPDVKVRVQSASAKPGEEVVFLFEGNADIISFYSGELFNDYEYRDGRSIDIASQPRYVQFTSSIQSGTQPNTVSIYISTDFNEDYTFSGVKNANWIDITDRFTWGQNSTFLGSSLQDITGLTDSSKPVYFAFRYISEPQLLNGTSRLWQIQNFEIVSGATLGGSNLTIASQEYTGFRVVEEDSENKPSRTTITGTRISFQGFDYKAPTDPIFDPNNPIFDPNNPIYDPQSPHYNRDAVLPVYEPFNAAKHDPRTETWAVSAPVKLDRVDLGPDKSIPVKGVDGGVLTQFAHMYQTPGSYKAYFVIANHNIYSSKTSVQAIPVMVSP